MNSIFYKKLHGERKRMTEEWIKRRIEWIKCEEETKMESDRIIIRKNKSRNKIWNMKENKEKNMRMYEWKKKRIE